jgi:sensor histidine kinase regulating citrate/malate metabolism
MKMFKKVSLKFQFTLFFVFFVVAIYSVVIVISIQQVAGLTRTISAELGIPIAKSALEILDGDSFEALAKNPDENDPYYQKAQAELLALKNTTRCFYLYTMVQVEGTIFRYIIDGSTTPDDEEHFSPIGTEEDIKKYSRPVLDALRTGEIQTSSIDYNREWGWTISTYAPILNSAGDAVGVVGCDFAADIYSRLWSQLIVELIVAGVFAILGFIAYRYLVNGLDRQNQNLRELKENAEAASLALKEERDTIAAMKDALKVGLFFMDKDFVIQSQYSKALESILAVKNLEGKKFTGLLTTQIKEQKLKNLMEYLVLLFNRSRMPERMSPDMLENLNPIQEMNYVSPETGEEKTLNCKFVPVDRGGGRLFILGNLQDITTETQLQRRLTEEAQTNREEISRLKSIVRNLEAGKEQ